VDVSCAFPPGPETVDHVVLAEHLGYRRAWMYDSPALYGDVWVHLALAATRTSRIGLGPAVLVPGLRHPLTQASAIATLAGLAPGRVAVAIGTGFTGRNALGQRPLPWAATGSYVRAVRDLLAGETVELDGARVRMLAPDGFLPPRPIAVPIVVAANGPKGLAVARELGDGVMSVLGPQPGFDWSALLVLGTVLDADEEVGSERALAAAGPGLTVVYHGAWEAGEGAVDALPGGAEWRARLEAEVPPGERHLAVHADHLVRVTERDRPLLDGELLRAFTWTGSTEEVRARLEGFAAAGGTEVLYAPMGPDVPRELRRFAEAAGLP